MAIKKNWREKGSRDEDLGSNPHSKGEFFSRSMMTFFERIEAKIITTVEIVIRPKAIKKIEKIIYTIVIIVLMIGSRVYLYTI